MTDSVTTARSAKTCASWIKTAIALCRENNLPIVLFDMNVPGNIHKVVLGERVGTTVAVSESAS